MKTVLLLGGPAAGQRVEIHGTMRTWNTSDDKRGYFYHVVPMCSHGEVQWFGVLEGADPLALLIAGYAPGVAAPRLDDLEKFVEGRIRDGLTVFPGSTTSTGRAASEPQVQDCPYGRPGKFS